MKLFERAIRRAEIPIHMSEGFNPRPKISYPMALAVGVEGVDEVVEVELNEWVRPSTLLGQLKHQLPQGIEIATVEPVSPKGSAQVGEVTYRITLAVPSLTPPLADGREGGIKTRADKLLQRKEIVVCREKDGKKRYFNIRPSIINIVAGTDSFELRLRITPEGTARPEEVVSALGLDNEIDYRLLKITRTKIRLKG